MSLTEVYASGSTHIFFVFKNDCCDDIIMFFLNSKDWTLNAVERLFSNGFNIDFVAINLCWELSPLSLWSHFQWF